MRDPVRRAQSPSSVEIVSLFANRYFISHLICHNQLLVKNAFTGLKIGA